MESFISSLEALGSGNPHRRSPAAGAGPAAGAWQLQGQLPGKDEWQGTTRKPV